MGKKSDKTNYYTPHLVVAIAATSVVFSAYVLITNAFGPGLLWAAMVGSTWLVLIVVIVLYNLAELTSEKRITDADRYYSTWFAMVLMFDWYIFETFRNKRHRWRAWKHDYIY